ncbi:MAG TPA: CopG family antitoxin [Caldilineaceae bacterium]|nr:hypothetical protein [Caldilineaceae bacterium]HRW11092.1 CopG family antitoxin [Caldilineaceae bacterium]
MNDTNKTKQIDPIPEEFDSYEEAAEFWDNHDTTDYPDEFVTVHMNTELRQRHYVVELDEDVVITLRKLASKKGVAVRKLASELLRDRLLAV